MGNKLMIGMLKKMSFEDFVEKANCVHGKRYSYDEKSYTSASGKMNIICSEHGPFEMVGSMHLHGQKCRSCSISDRLQSSRVDRSNKFIELSIKIHLDRYYYGDVEYLNNRSPVKISCTLCGNSFSQRPDCHTKGAGCPNCAGNKRLTTDEFISKANRVHGDKYTYEFVEYVNTSTDIIVTCKVHGNWTSTPNNILCGCGCPKCGYESTSASNRHTLDDFKIKANMVHSGKYDYSEVDYFDSNTKVKIKCTVHDIFFEQTPGNHLRGAGCPTCNSSKGELKILKYLTANNIEFKPQYKFNECRNKYPLPFDFMIVSRSGVTKCIEFHGGQHYHPVNRFGGIESYEKLIKRDAIKKKFCEANSIPLLIIGYWEIDRVDEILSIFC